MFENSLYTLTELKPTENGVWATIQLNPEHDIFKGHFPQMPILPGVCTLQIIKEILSKALHCRLQLVQGDNLKFTSVVNPVENALMQFEINIGQPIAEQLTITAQVQNAGNIAFKMKGTYQCCK